MKIREFVERVLAKFEIENFWLYESGYVGVESITGSTIVVIRHNGLKTIKVSIQGWNRPSIGMIEVDIVICVWSGVWEVTEIAYSPAAWQEYLICAPGDGLIMFDETGNILKSSFADYWAIKLMTSGWMRKCKLDDVVLEEPVEVNGLATEESMTSDRDEIRQVEAPALRAVKEKGYQLALF